MWLLYLCVLFILFLSGISFLSNTRHFMFRPPFHDFLFQRWSHTYTFFELRLKREIFCKIVRLFGIKSFLNLGGKENFPLFLTLSFFVIKTLAPKLKTLRMVWFYTKLFNTCMKYFTPTYPSLNLCRDGKSTLVWYFLGYIVWKLWPEHLITHY